VLTPFKVDPEFQKLSYAQRYERVCLRMVRELLYDAACVVTSNSTGGQKGLYAQPNPELSIKNFARSLHARAASFAKVS